MPKVLGLESYYSLSPRPKAIFKKFASFFIKTKINNLFTCTLSVVLGPQYAAKNHSLRKYWNQIYAFIIIIIIACHLKGWKLVCGEHVLYENHDKETGGGVEESAETLHGRAGLPRWHGRLASNSSGLICAVALGGWTSERLFFSDCQVSHLCQGEGLGALVSLKKEKSKFKPGKLAHSEIEALNLDQTLVFVDQPRASRGHSFQTGPSASLCSHLSDQN